MITLGIDVGSISTKAVLLKDDQIAASLIRETVGDISQKIEGMLDELLREAGVSPDEVNCCVSSGQGEDLVERADFSEDDIACVAVATRHLLPDTELAIDIGGQSISTILSDPAGDILNYMRNDKCASGSGRFIEVIGTALGVAIEDIDSVAEKSRKKVPVSTQCAVFAESEVISYVNLGEAVPDIIAGVCDSMARIIVSQAMRIGPVERFTVTGGVASFSSVVNILKERLQGIYCPLPIDPRLTVAYGAALIGQEE
ncbi:MAG: hypothetical protein GYA86_10215 [Firmicutes bacterium]|nr:hypothetical protein [Bacillota bacterium]